jgi:hypothetical protein
VSGIAEADQDLTLADLASAKQLAAEYGVHSDTIRAYEDLWPECVVRIGDRVFFVRSRFKERLLSNLLRPRAKRRRPPPKPQRTVREGGNAVE